MAFELDHVGAVVDVTVTDERYVAQGALFAVDENGIRITVSHPHMGAGGPSRGRAAFTKSYFGPPLPEDPDLRRQALVSMDAWG